MPESRLDRARGKRIADEIVVDCHASEKRAMGRYYYLEEKFSFPFAARCAAIRPACAVHAGKSRDSRGGRGLALLACVRALVLRPARIPI
jgi:hypothetical protein